MIDFQHIRNKILDKAVRGELVLQSLARPVVGIDREEQDDIPYAVPATWRWCRLSTVVSDIVDCAHSTPQYSSTEGKYLAIDTNCIDKNGRIKHWRYVTEEIYRLRTRKLLPQKNDIIYTREGSIGRAAVLPDEVKVCMGQRVMLIRPGMLINPLYLQKYLMSPNTLTRLTGNQRGIGVKHVNVSDVKNILIPVPPETEQRRIVARLEELLSVVDKAEKAQERLATLAVHYKNALLDRAIRGELVPQLDTEPVVDIDCETPEDVPFAIPEKWQWMNVSDVIQLISGRDLDKTQILESPSDNAIPYLTGASQIEESRVLITRWTLNACVVSKMDDLLLTCKGTVGKVAFNTVGEMHIARQIMAIRVKKEVVLRAFFYYFLQALVPRLRTLAQGLIPGISRKDVLSPLIPVPPLAEQRRIVARLEELLPEVDKLVA